MDYKIVIHGETIGRVREYISSVRAGETHAGTRLHDQLDHWGDKPLTDETCIDVLLNTKMPQIFAESAVAGDGSDWNPTELSLLGDISIAVSVTVYDNGLHYQPVVYTNPFEATLVYVPGPLLRNDRGYPPADWDAVTASGGIDTAGYYSLIARRLLPVFKYVNEVAGQAGKQALVTIPGVGCGQFAGKFRGRMGGMLKGALVRLLEDNPAAFPNLQVVYFDPYKELYNERLEIGNITFLVRPLMQGNESKPQLCPPGHYEEEGDDFSQCMLFSIVAWDHVSWPGNDFYLGSRTTDDGVKAAATDSMAVMTGIKGAYNKTSNTYDPPAGYRSWAEVVKKQGLNLVVDGNLMVFY